MRHIDTKFRAKTLFDTGTEKTIQKWLIKIFPTFLILFVLSPGVVV